jgi:histidinol-phosphatase
MVLGAPTPVKPIDGARHGLHAARMDTSPELSAALEAAEAAARVLREHYQQPLAVERKADGSPVSVADLAAEGAIREVLRARFPKFGIYGEEGGRSGDESSLWLVDPLDGTKAYVRGYPMFSTQIALMRAGRLVLGVSSAPLYGELAFAEEGWGAWLNGRPLKVSAIEDIAQAALSSGNLRSLASSHAWGRYGHLVARVNRIRGYGDFLHYHLLAAGRIDAVLESDVHILDVAALAVIVREAGGRVTTLAGEQLGLGSTSILATNGRLHGAILTALG